jgi:hypothetical protein
MASRRQPKIDTQNRATAGSWRCAAGGGVSFVEMRVVGPELVGQRRNRGAWQVEGIWPTGDRPRCRGPFGTIRHSQVTNHGVKIPSTHASPPGNFAGAPSSPTLGVAAPAGFVRLPTGRLRDWCSAAEW